METPRVYCIGMNQYGELGFGSRDAIRKLTQFPNKSITKVYPCSFYIIFADDTFKKVWGAGSNSNNKIGADIGRSIFYDLVRIKYFEENNIILKKICQNVSGITSYYISDKDRLYGVGNEYRESRPTIVAEEVFASRSNIL